MKVTRHISVRFHGESIKLSLVASTDKLQIFRPLDSNRHMIVIADENDVVHKILCSAEKIVIHDEF